MKAPLRDGLRRRKLIRVAIPSLKLALGIGLCWWLVATEQLQLEVYRELAATLDVGLLILVALCQFLSFSIVVARWWVLARANGIGVPMSAVLRTGYQGLFTSLVVPGGLGIDGLRILYLRMNHPDHMSRGLSTLLMDRVAGFTGLLVLGLGASLLYLLTEESGSLWGLILIQSSLLGGLLVGLGILYWMATVSEQPFPWLKKWTRLRSFMTSLSAHRHHHGAVAQAIVVSMLGHFVNCISWFVGLALMGYHISLVGVVAVTAIVSIVRTIPITPMGLGVSDGVAEAVYRMVGVPVGAELQMIVRAVGMLVLLACGLAFIGKRPLKRR